MVYRVFVTGVAQNIVFGTINLIFADSTKFTLDY